jgi:hypothetical protein
MLASRLLRSRIASAAFVPAAVAAACAVASCGGGAAALSPSAPAAPSASANALRAAAVRGPVAAPPNLVVSGRFARLSASFATVQKWTNLPMPQSQQATELLTSDDVGPLVDLDHPVDFAVATAGVGMRLRGLFAVSAGIKDIDAAKASLGERFKLVPGADDTTLIQGLGSHHRRSDQGGGGDDDDDADGDADGNQRVCALAPPPSEGTSAHIVCAWDAKALAELEPWLARRPSPGATEPDLHVDVQMKPLKPTILALRRMVSLVVEGVLGGRIATSGSRDLAVAVAADMVDFALDVDSAVFDVDLSDDKGASVRAQVQFSGVSSRLARLATAHPDGAAPPPAIFWQLPGDADLAVFERGDDSDVLSGARDLLAKAVWSKLEEYGVKEADRKAITDAVGSLPSSAPALYASGFDEDALKKALSATRKPSQSPGSDAVARRDVGEALLGWRLLALDEPPARIASAMGDLANAWSRPGIATSFRSAPKDLPRPSFRTIALPKAAALPKGTLHFVLELPLSGPDGAKSAVKPLPLTLHAFVVPDGVRTWVGVGGDDALVVSKLATVLGGGAGLGRPELASFKESQVGAGGFITVKGVAETMLFVQALTGDGGAGAADFLDDLAQAPHHGATPMPFALTARSGGQSPVVNATLQVPRGVIEDALQDVVRRGGF